MTAWSAISRIFHDESIDINISIHSITGVIALPIVSQPHYVAHCLIGQIEGGQTLIFIDCDSLDKKSTIIGMRIPDFPTLSIVGIQLMSYIASAEW